MPLDPETKRLRKLSPAALADEAGALKAKTEAIKDEAIRRGLHRAEGQFWKLALTPPGQSNRTDKSRLLAVLGISEIEYIARYTSPAQTDWVMRCTPRKVLRTAEQEPVVLPPAKRETLWKPEKLSVADRLGTSADRIDTDEERSLPRRRGPKRAA